MAEGKWQMCRMNKIIEDKMMKRWGTLLKSEAEAEADEEKEWAVDQ
jgi:hypothetical protein